MELIGFKVTARTIFHLGADLISSDAVALYELVKNAFDAKSDSVTIDVRQRVTLEEFRTITDEIRVAIALQAKLELENDSPDREGILRMWKRSAPSMAPAEPPARRVLPSLVPMFAMLDELDAPEVGKVPEAKQLPRVQRVKPPTKRKQKVVAQDDPGLSFAGAQDELDDTPVLASPGSTQPSGGVSGPALAQARTSRRAQQAAAALRPGERWKRRLPRALW